MIFKRKLYCIIYLLNDCSSNLQNTRNENSTSVISLFHANYRDSIRMTKYLGGAGSSATSSSTTALSLSPRLSSRSRASHGGESLVPVFLSASRLCNCLMTLCCLRIIASRCAKLASISFCFLHSLDSKSNSCDDRVRSCSAFSRVSLATRSSCGTTKAKTRYTNCRLTNSPIL